MMRVLKEITDWDVPNHTYFVTGGKDKMFAYIKASGNVIEEFVQPLPFSTTRRKFKEVENTWGFIPKVAEVVELAGIQYKVPGSNGAVYTVTDDHGVWSCSCPSAKWQKGDCKHVKKIKLSAQ
jgi:hypothetical protein